MLRRFNKSGEKCLKTCFAGWLSTLGLLVLTLGGCGGHEVTLVPVEGKVVRTDGKPWPNKGMIFFAPTSAAPGYPLRGAYARFDTDGHFVAGTFEPRDGVVPGQYLVTLRCWEIPPSPEGNHSGKSCIPPEFQSAGQSKLELEVPADDSETIVVEFEVPSA